MCIFEMLGFKPFLDSNYTKICSFHVEPVGLQYRIKYT